MSTKEKKLLFSVTHDDFEFQFFPCGTKGGQSANRDHSGARLIHKASGARGESREFKSQGQNKEAAFLRLMQTKEWKNWHKAETSRRLLNYNSIEAMIEDAVDKAMLSANIKTEVRGEDGKWEEIE